MSIGIIKCGVVLNSIMNFLFHYIDPFLREMFAVIVTFIGQINEVILGKEDHSGCADIAFAWNNANTAFQTPAMGNLVDRKEFIKVFFSYFVGTVTDHIVEKLFYRQAQLSQKNPF
jgi:hypothetical protein